MSASFVLATHFLSSLIPINATRVAVFLTVNEEGEAEFIHVESRISQYG
jgi:hypothetical protein